MALLLGAICSLISPEHQVSPDNWQQILVQHPTPKREVTGKLAAGQDSPVRQQQKLRPEAVLDNPDEAFFTWPPDSKSHINPPKIAVTQAHLATPKGFIGLYRHPRISNENQGLAKASSNYQASILKTHAQQRSCLASCTVPTRLRARSGLPASDDAEIWARQPLRLSSKHIPKPSYVASSLDNTLGALRTAMQQLRQVKVKRWSIFAPIVGRRFSSQDRV